MVLRSNVVEVVIADHLLRAVVSLDSGPTIVGGISESVVFDIKERTRSRCKAGLPSAEVRWSRTSKGLNDFRSGVVDCKRVISNQACTVMLKVQLGRACTLVADVIERVVIYLAYGSR